MAALRQAGATPAEIAEQLNREGFRPPRGTGGFHRGHVKQFLIRYGVLRPGASPRIDPAGLGPDEWRLGDLASGLGMPSMTLRHWQSRGWVTGWKSSPVGGCWILWADKPELERLRRLRAWHRRGYNCQCPAELRTPGGPRERQAHRRTNAVRGSRRNSPRSRGRNPD